MLDWEAITPIIPTDHARQVTSRYYIDRLPKGGRVVDVGCGTGASLSLFRSLDEYVRWIGVDIGDSQEAQARPPIDAPVVLYDGVNIPLASGSADMVYSHQVFEHVLRPRELLVDIARILAPGGFFAGSTSQLEPYHSRSLWNYTVPGFCTLVREAGMEMLEVRPSIDGITLTQRAFTGKRAEFGRWFAEESPLNQQIDDWARATRRGAGAANGRKLRFCGQFAFLAHRPH